MSDVISTGSEGLAVPGGMDLRVRRQPHVLTIAGESASHVLDILAKAGP